MLRNLSPEGRLMIWGDQTASGCLTFAHGDNADYLHGGEAGRARFAEAVGQAMEEIGFAVLVGHGIDPALLDRTEQTVARFFAETAEAARQPYLAQRHGSVNQGYFPIE